MHVSRRLGPNDGFRLHFGSLSDVSSLDDYGPLIAKSGREPRAALESAYDPKRTFERFMTSRASVSSLTEMPAPNLRAMPINSCSATS